MWYTSFHTLYIYLALACCICFDIVYLQDPIVRTPLGDIQGTIQTSRNGTVFNAFVGVPYSEPQTGRNKFHNPTFKNPWSGVWVANVKYECIQYTHLNDRGWQVSHTEGDEDCLYLNIYTSTTNRQANLDVLIYMHGGRFTFGASYNYHPNVLLNYPIVFVTINYRLGPIGFLTTEDNQIPGNLGLRDQLCAMEWVKRYISYFGGNPNSITLGGFSAGAASVQLHYMMPKSRQLFDRGISNSGTALNAWVLMEDGLEKTKKIAALLGCSTKSTWKIRECLESRSAKQIVDTFPQFQVYLDFPNSPFGVVIDGKWCWVDSVLPDHPYKLLIEKRVSDLPWLVTFVGAEGLDDAGEIYNDVLLAQVDTNWNDLMPFILDYNYTVAIQLHNNVSQQIRQFYLQNATLTKSNFRSFVQLTSDRLFNLDIFEAAKLQSAAMMSNVFSYNFNYRGQGSNSELFTNTTENLGVAHGDDVAYIVDFNLVVTNSTANDQLMGNILSEIVVSFVQTGVPSVPMAQWNSVAKNVNENFRYLLISSPTNMVMIEFNFQSIAMFWNSLPIMENSKY